MQTVQGPGARDCGHRRKRDHRGAGPASIRPRRRRRCLSVGQSVLQQADAGRFVSPFHDAGRQGAICRSCSTTFPAARASRCRRRPWRGCSSTKTSSRSKNRPACLDMASEIRSLCDIPILSGDDSLTLPLMSIGAIGSSASPAMSSRRTSKQMVTRAHGRQFRSRCGRFIIEVFPFIKTLFLDGNPVGIKHAMKLAGTRHRRVAAAAVGGERGDEEAIEEQMRRSGYSD